MTAAEPQKTLTPNHNNWLFFWGAAIPLFAFVSFYELHTLQIPLSSFQLAATILFVSMILLFFISTGSVVGGYPFFKYPISSIARTEIKGRANLSAVILYFVFSAIGWCLIMLLAILLKSYYYWDPWQIANSYLLYLAGIGGMAMAVIPINIFRKGHLLSALTFFSTYLTVDIILLIPIYFVMPTLNIYSALGYLHILCAFLYILGYFTHYRASMFQKFWYFSFQFSLYGFIWFYTKILL